MYKQFPEGADVNRFCLFLFTLAVLTVWSCPAFAGLERCAGCHNNRASFELKDRYKTAAELIRAAKNSKSPMMGSVRANEEYLRDAAKELGLK